jgi:hypothetical protein
VSTITTGVDLAKVLFSACEMDGSGHGLHRLDPKRDAFAMWLASWAPFSLRERFTSSAAEKSARRVAQDCPPSTARALCNSAAKGTDQIIRSRLK